jgi:fibronectin type 3 domain-containing protein
MKRIFGRFAPSLFALITLVNFSACGGGGGGGTVIGTPSHSSAIPSSPTMVVSTAGNAQVTVSWNAVTGAISYNVYWSTTAGVSKATGTKVPGITNTTLLHTGLTNDIAYYYVVTAVNGSGESVESAGTSAQPINSPPPPPPAPFL